MNSQRGFTLIEILIVLVIIGLLFGWIVGKISGKGDELKAKLTQTKIKDIALSIEQFRLQYNQLPQSLDDLIQCTGTTGQGCIPLMKRDGIMDAWNNPFQYSLLDGGRRFRIKSLGADGREGGEGVDSDFFGEGP